MRLCDVFKGLSAGVEMVSTGSSWPSCVWDTKEDLGLVRSNEECVLSGGVSMVRCVSDLAQVGGTDADFEVAKGLERRSNEKTGRSWKSRLNCSREFSRRSVEFLEMAAGATEPPTLPVRLNSRSLLNLLKSSDEAEAEPGGAGLKERVSMAP